MKILPGDGQRNLYAFNLTNKLNILFSPFYSLSARLSPPGAELLMRGKRNPMLGVNSADSSYLQKYVLRHAIQSNKLLCYLHSSL